MANFNKVSVANEARTELHDKLQLTGAEVSVNNLPAGASVPFVHYHKKNEEIYFITAGRGKAVIDGENEGISYVCIQVKENSLEEYTNTDGVVEQ